MEDKEVGELWRERYDYHKHEYGEVIGTLTVEDLISKLIEERKRWYLEKDGYDFITALAQALRDFGVDESI